jgi:hypothetical protein
MVDEAYKDRTEWIKKSIRTVAKVRVSCCFTVCKISVLTNVLDGQVQLGPRDPGLRPGVLEHRVAEARVSRGVQRGPVQHHRFYVPVVQLYRQFVYEACARHGRLDCNERVIATTCIMACLLPPCSYNLASLEAVRRSGLRNLVDVTLGCSCLNISSPLVSPSLVQTRD